MPEIKYKCVICHMESHVSENYLHFSYVQAKCCSVACERKIPHRFWENTQDGGVEEIELEFVKQ